MFSMYVWVVVFLGVQNGHRNGGTVNGEKTEYLILKDDSWDWNFLICSPRGSGLIDAKNVAIWSVVHTNPPTEIILGSCRWDGSCTSNFPSTINPKISVTGYSVVLRVHPNVTRTLFGDGTLVCNVSSPDGVTLYNSSCRCNVMSRPDYNCTEKIDKNRWRVVTTCDVSNFYTSLGIYKCFMLELWNQSRYPFTYENTIYRNWTVLLIKKEKYVKESTGWDYYRGQCLFSVALPTDYGNVSYYVSLVNGLISDKYFFHHPKYHQVIETARYFIDFPHPPSHNCSAGGYVIPEMSSSKDPTCGCRTDYLGRPEGRLRWLTEGEVLAEGEYAVRSLALPTDRLNRTHNFAIVTCQLDWIRNTGIGFTALISYGPDNISLSHLGGYLYTNGTYLPTFACTSLGASYPEVDYEWGGVCQGQRGKICNLTLNPSVDEDSTVTCSAINKANNNHVVTLTKTLSELGAVVPQTCARCPCATDDQVQSASEDRMQGVAIGAASTLGLVLAVVAVIATVILWRRGKLPRCTGCNPVYDRPATRGNQSRNEIDHTYMDLSPYEAVGAEGPA